MRDELAGNDFAFYDPAKDPASPNIDLSSLSPHEIKKLIDLYEIYKVKVKTSGTAKWFAPGTPYSIDQCPKHKEFFKAGLIYPERLFMAANRAGKSIAGAFETACHLTGEYPDWWVGKRFDHAVSWWAGGKIGQTVRDTVQKELLGNPGEFGTGMLPKDRIIRVYAKPGIPNGVELVEVKHKSGNVSNLGFKSYDQNVQAFYGTAKDGVWLDEECPEIIYNECLIRTMTTGGIVFVTFTPLHGLTPFIVNFSKNADYLADAREIVAGLSEEDDVHKFRY